MLARWFKRSKASNHDETSVLAAYSYVCERKKRLIIWENKEAVERISIIPHKIPSEFKRIGIQIA